MVWNSLKTRQTGEALRCGCGVESREQAGMGVVVGELQRPCSGSAPVQALFPDSVFAPTGLGTARLLEGLFGASSGAGPGGGRVLSPEAVGTWGSSHHPAGRAWPRPAEKGTLRRGDWMLRLGMGQDMAESQPQGA